MVNSHPTEAAFYSLKGPLLPWKENGKTENWIKPHSNLSHCAWGWRRHSVWIGIPAKYDVDRDRPIVTNLEVVWLWERMGVDFRRMLSRKGSWKRAYGALCWRSGKTLGIVMGVTFACWIRGKFNFGITEVWIHLGSFLDSKHGTFTIALSQVTGTRICMQHCGPIIPF